MAREGTPAFTGLVQHSDARWRISFWYPDGWHKLDMAAGREGAAYAPDADNAATSFSYEVKNVRVKVSGADLDRRSLRGLHRGTQQAARPQDRMARQVGGWDVDRSGSEVHLHRAGSHAQTLGAAALRNHAPVSYRRPGDAIDEYAYWEPMLYECMATVKID